MIVVIGSRGVRSRSVPVRPTPRAPDPPPAPVTMRRRVPSPPRVALWVHPVVGIAVGWLIGSLLLTGFGHEGQRSSVRIVDLALVGLVVALVIIRRRQLAPSSPNGRGGDVRRRVEMPPVPGKKAG